MTSLMQLFLHVNGLVGNIPPDLGQLTGLQFLYLSDNKLSGDIPVELGGLTNLRRLTLANNQLSGCVPPALSRGPQSVGLTDCFAVEGATLTVSDSRLLSHDALSITSVGDGVNGTVLMDGTTIIYEHDGSETTSGSFTYTLSDGTDTSTAMVTITVTPVNDFPMAVGDTAAVDEG